MSGVTAQLFGKFSVARDGEHIRGIDSRKVQELFSYLLIHYEHPQPRETLAEVLWENQPTAKSKKNLRQTLWRLQTALDYPFHHATPTLLVEEDWVQVNAAAQTQMDIAEFESAYNQFNHRRVRDLSNADFNLLEKSIALYKGPLLEGWYQDWCVFERERFQVMHTALLDKLVQFCEVNQLFDAGIAYCAEILRYDRAYERAHRQMMRLYYMAGDRTQALRQYERCVSALREELGVAPSDRTEHLHEQLRTDRFTPPAFSGNRTQTSEVSGDTPLSDVLLRLQSFSATLNHIQFQVQREILAIENSIQAHQ